MTFFPIFVHPVGGTADPETDKHEEKMLDNYL